MGMSSGTAAPIHRHRPRPLGRQGDCPGTRRCRAISVLPLKLVGNLQPRYWSRTCSYELRPLRLREGALGYQPTNQPTKKTNTHMLLWISLALCFLRGLAEIQVGGQGRKPWWNKVGKPSVLFSLTCSCPCMG